MPTSTAIPLLLLKTRTTPVDTYETHFSRSSSPFTPSFIPVLEHQPNEHNLARIKELLRERRLTEEYGGVIFTSQRAVEGFARVVGELDEEEEKVRQGKIVGTESGSMVSPILRVFPFLHL
jgi:uroporphyrinogen-III synthase